MPEPSSTRAFVRMKDDLYLEADSLEPSCANCPEQLRLDLGEWDGEDSAPEVESSEWVRKHPQTTLFPELKQARSPIQHQVERIQNLEQALDQSLECIAEMRAQLANQHFLEAQLASTEEIANIQQQAITHLKHQLAQQQSALEVQRHESQGQHQYVQDLLAMLEDLATGQQPKLDQLQTYAYTVPVLSGEKGMPHAEPEIQQNLMGQHLTALQDTAVTQQQRSLEFAPPVSGSNEELVTATPETIAANLSLAETAVQTLRQTLGDREAAIHQLETELHRAHTVLQEQQSLIDSLQQAYAVKQSLDRPSDSELFSAHCKIQELETQLSKQTTSQAMVHHAYQELEQICDRHQARLTELERHSADMQEQILKQAQQASEYETAIQHWKDRHHTSKDYLLKLINLVEQIPNPPSNIAALLTEIHTAIVETPDSDSLSSPATSLPHWGIKKDLPDFLARRQRYRGATKSLPAREKNAAIPTKTE